MVNVSTLRRILECKFSEEELRTLCADLKLDYDTLSGDNKEAKARELVAYFERRDNLMDLVNALRAARPGTVVDQPIYRLHRKEQFMPPLSISESNLTQTQFDRLIAAVDRLTEKLGTMSTEVALLTQRMLSIEGRLVSVEGQIHEFAGTRPASWQTYLVIVLGLCVAIALAILFYGLGKQ